MAKKMHLKQHKFRGFPEISQSFIYTYRHSKEKMALWNVNDITCAETELRSVTFSLYNARNFDMRDLLP